MRLRQKLLFIGLSMMLFSVQAASASFLPPDALKYDSMLLDNGLQMVVQRVQGAPYVSLRLVIRTGTGHYPCAARELPHLLEHLLFSANSVWTEGEVDDQVSKWGGSINAYTYAEQTEVVLDVHSSFEKNAVLLAATMMSAFAPQSDDVVREVRVVERESGAAHAPLLLWWSRQPFAQLAASRFGQAAGFQCEGGLSPVRHLGLTDVQQAFSTYYIPANMMLILVGDLSDAGIAAARTAFSALPARPAPIIKPPHIAMPVDISEKKFRSGWLSGTSSLNMPMALGVAPFQDQEGHHALLLVESWLNERMFRELRSQRGIAYTPMASIQHEADALSVMLAVETAPDDAAFVVDYLNSLVDEVRASGIPQHDFERMLSSSLLGMAQSFERISDRADYFAASSRELAEGQLFNSEIFYRQLDYSRFRALVARDWPARFVVLDNSPRVAWHAWIALLGGSILLLTAMGGMLLWRWMARRRSAVMV